MNEELLTPIQNGHTYPTLAFYDGQCLFRMVSRAGTKIERFVSWAAVREAATAIPIDSGWLAPEVVRWGTGRHGDWVVAFIPPGRHELELTVGVPGPEEQIERVTAPLPGLVMFSVATKYFIWAQKTDHIEPHHELYRCPLPNVMQDASICWGLLKPPQASPRTILKAWELFIRSTFNNHAASGKSKSKREDVRERLKDLSGRCGDDPDCTEVPVHEHPPEDRYPVEDLVRQVEGGGATIDKLLREFWETGVMPG